MSYLDCAGMSLRHLVGECRRDDRVLASTGGIDNLSSNNCGGRWTAGGRQRSGEMLGEHLPALDRSLQSGCDGSSPSGTERSDRGRCGAVRSRVSLVSALRSVSLSGTHLFSLMVLVLVMVIEYDVQMLEQLRPACSSG